MKKFKYPLHITGTPEQFMSLAPKLAELGYNVPTPLRMLLSMVTNASGRRGEVNTFTILNDDDYERTEVSASNPDLVLALAAMVDDDKFYEGEYAFCKKDHTGLFSGKKQFTEGELYKVEDAGETTLSVVRDDDGYKNGWSLRYFRKATKEEIMNKFKEEPKDVGTMNVSVSSLEDKPLQETIEAPVDFIRAVKNMFATVGNLPMVDKMEEMFPTLFPRPTFRVGDEFVYLKQTVEGTELVPMRIVGKKDSMAVTLLDVMNDIAGEDVLVSNQLEITEAELFRAGQHINLNKTNYAQYC